MTARRDNSAQAPTDLRAMHRSVALAAASVIASAVLVMPTCTVVVPSACGAVSRVPAILTQPQDQSIRSGESVSFSATASGEAPLHHQWQFNGNNLPDATNTTFTVTNAQLTNAGFYRILVSNSFGTAPSVQARLTVSE